MAHTTLVGMLREDGAAKSMGAVMKEIVSAMNAPEETRRVLREQIDEACNSKKTTESSRNSRCRALKPAGRPLPHCRGGNGPPSATRRLGAGQLWIPRT